MSVAPEGGLAPFLDRELAKSERLRATVAALLFGAFVVGTSAAHLLGVLAAELYLPIGPAPLIVWSHVALGILIAAELGARALLARAQRVPALYRWLVTPLELGMVAALTWLFATAMDPAVGVQSPTILVFGLVLVLSALHLDARISMASGLVAAVCYVAVVWGQLGTYEGRFADTFLTAVGPHVVRALLLLLTGAATGFVTLEIQRRLQSALDAQRAHERTLEVLGQQLSPAVARALMDGGGEGRIERMCVLFLDIRDFTATAQHQTPGETVAWLNGVFDGMIDTVNRHGGIVNKFLGDGFMAVFGPPFSDANPSAAAITAAMEITEVRSGPTRVGIGLHVGDVVVGNVGSSTRREYTVIGDTVNLASRVESLNKTYESQVLVTEESYAEGGAQWPALRRIEGVQVKGREEPVVVVQLR